MLFVSVIKSINLTFTSDTGTLYLYECTQSKIFPDFFLQLTARPAAFYPVGHINQSSLPVTTQIHSHKTA